MIRKSEPFYVNQNDVSFENATEPAKTVCLQVDQNGNITEVKKED